MISAVFFDVDDTLVDFAAAASAGLIEAVPGADYADWLAMAQSHYDRYTSGELDFQTMRDQRMAAFLAGLGRPADPQTAAAAEASRTSMRSSRGRATPTSKRAASRPG